MAPLAGRFYAIRDAFNDTAIVADTGGTTYDVSLVRSGDVPFTREMWIGEPFRGHMTGFPSVDVRSIGAGGGRPLDALKRAQKASGLADAMVAHLEEGGLSPLSCVLGTAIEEGEVDTVGMRDMGEQPELDPKSYGFTDADMDRPIFLDGVLGLAGLFADRVDLHVRLGLDLARGHELRLRVGHVGALLLVEAHDRHLHLPSALHVHEAHAAVGRDAETGVPAVVRDLDPMVGRQLQDRGPLLEINVYSIDRDVRHDVSGRSGPWWAGSPF